MSVRPEVIPFAVATLILGIAVGSICRFCGVKTAPSVIAGGVVAVVMTGYMLYFFRDPERTSPPDESLIVAGADGVIARISEIRENELEDKLCQDQHIPQPV